MSISQKQFEEKIVETVLALSALANPDFGREHIRKNVDLAIQMLITNNRETEEYSLDKDKIVEVILRKRSAGTSFHTLKDFQDTNHEEWLDTKRYLIEEGSHWNAFKKYLERQISEPQIKEIDRSTNSILGAIEDPERSGTWFSRGLVIGDVQSGKTTNFIGVCNKALDAGYKVVVVLSGLHNNLREQTQIRFEEGVTGWNTSLEETEKLCGVSKLLGADAEKIRISHLTNRGEDGDFISSKNPGVILGQSPLYSINKKNKDTLGHLINYFRLELEGRDSSSVPILLIDDEADNASVDTSKEDNEGPSAINRLIKELLNLFPKKAYIGYTATPFANILINPEEGDDLFPHNFISILGRPENYIGASRVFGEISDAGEEKGGDNAQVVLRQTELNWFVNLDDNPYFDDWKSFIPEPNKKSSIDFMDELPLSLKEAIYSFLISVSIRNLRGDRFQHKTMLIHATRLVTLQERLKFLVNDFIQEIYYSMTNTRNGAENVHTLQMQEIFKYRYPEVSEKWKDIRYELRETIALTLDHVFEVNGNSKDVIDEKKWKNGLTSIRVGGEKLSRGLTLQGLITSYFLRVSKPYDTLMQMGRWFGYRDNYEDLCQIYTTAQLFNWFGHIANASERLRDRVFEMNRIEMDPTEYRQQIQSHPGAMLVTALNKQRFARNMSLSFASDLVQLTTFELAEQTNYIQHQNLDLVKKLMRDLLGLIKPENTKAARIFRGAEASTVTDFISAFEHSKGAGTWHSESLCKYISAMAAKGELVNWTIAFQTSTKPDKNSEVFKIEDWKVHSNFRDGGADSFGRFTINRQALVSPGHEKFDFPKNEQSSLKGMTRKQVQGKRPCTRGLLIIYLVTLGTKDAQTGLINVIKTVPALAVSFPRSENAEKITYLVGTGFDGLIEEGFD